MSAPMLGFKRPNHWRIKLGGFEIIQLHDGQLHMPGPKPPFATDQTPETVAAHCAANHLPSDKLENSYTCTMINTGSSLVLFDTGNGSSKQAGGQGFLLKAMAEAGYTPDQVDVVVTTHCHPDHFLGLIEGGKPAYPKARYVFGQKEFDYWKKGDDVPEWRVPTREGFLKFCLPFADQSTFIKEGSTVVPGITAVEAFGHSPGHMAFNVESEGKRLYIWNDVTNHYVMSLQRPEWGVHFDHDKPAAIAVRKKTLDMVSHDKCLAIGFHMPFPAFGYVDKTSEGYRWVPASYQWNFS
jgi:glyoxylase-like metal-dependent hydrolase (beta-lactamase superfamily II)